VARDLSADASLLTLDALELNSSILALPSDCHEHN